MDCGQRELGDDRARLILHRELDRGPQIARPEDTPAQLAQCVGGDAARVFIVVDDEDIAMRRDRRFRIVEVERNALAAGEVSANQLSLADCSSSAVISQRVPTRPAGPNNPCHRSHRARSNQSAPSPETLGSQRRASQPNGKSCPPCV